MFAITQEQENGFKKIVLRDTLTGTVAEIIPSCGAILHTFIVEQNGQKINLIEQYAGKDDFDDNVTAKGFRSCKLSPFACRINNAQYMFAAEQYRVEKFLLNGSALHGLLYDAAFSVTGSSCGENYATVKMLHQYKGSDKGYPFHYDCQVIYTLAKENTLTVSTTITNKDRGLMPLQDGWHPYFSFGNNINDLELEFQSKEILEFNDELIPTGRLIPYREFGSLKKIGDTIFDNCFTLNFAECQPLCVLRDPAKKIQIEIVPDKSYPYLQLYTPPHRSSIAIENLSAAPDAFNNGMGLLVLEPGSQKEFITTYRVRGLV